MTLEDLFRNILKYVKELETIEKSVNYRIVGKKCNLSRTMNLVLSDFNSLAAVLLTRHSARSRNIGLQLQSKFVRRCRRCHYYHHHPHVSADYDSSARERRERERGRAGGGWGLPINAAAAAATTPDDPDAERRDAGERESPRDAKRGCAKRSPLPVYLCGIPTRVAPFPGTIVRRPDARVALCAVPVSSLGSETPTYDRWTLRVWADERERQRGRGRESEACISENWRYSVQSALAIHRPESSVSILIIISGTYATQGVTLLLFHC